MDLLSALLTEVNENDRMENQYDTKCNHFNIPRVTIAHKFEGSAARGTAAPAPARERAQHEDMRNDKRKETKVTQRLTSMIFSTWLACAEAEAGSQVQGNCRTIPNISKR
jgi:hypothetical protein